MGKLGKRIFIGLGLVFLVLLLAVGALLFFVDPNDYRDEIAALAYKTTGRQIELKGEIGLKFIPRLAFSIKDVSLAQAEGFGSEPLAQVSELSLQMAILPLLKKQFQVDAVYVDGLSVMLVKDKNGRGNWELPPAPDTTDAPEPSSKPEATGESTSQSQPGAPSSAPASAEEAQKQLESLLQSQVSLVRISNCSFSYEDKGVKDSLLRLAVNKLELGNVGLSRDITCALDASAELGQGIKGSLVMDGKLRYDLQGEVLTLNIASLLLGGEAPAFLAARQELKGSLSGRFDGKAGQGELKSALESAFFALNASAILKEKAISGALDFKSSPALLHAALSPNLRKSLALPPELLAPDGPLRSVDGKLNLGFKGNEFSASALEIRLDGGGLTLNAPSLRGVLAEGGGLASAEGSIGLKGGLRKLLPLAGITPGGSGNEFNKLEAGLSFSLKGGQAALSGLKFKLDDGLADFASKRVDISLAPAGPLLPIKSASGDFSLSARPRELMNALGIKLDTADPKALAQAQTSFNLALDNSSFKMSSFKGKLDETDMSALVELLLPGAKGLPKGATLYAKADLQMGNLNLDRYLAPAAPAAPEKSDKPAEAPKKGGSDGPLKGTPLEKAAGDFSASIKSLTIKGAPVQNIVLNASLSGGVFTVKKAALKAFDGQLESSAKADLVKAKGPGSLKASLKGLDLGQALKTLLDEKRLEGKAEANLDLSFLGADADSILGSLGGKGSLKVRDGALRDFQIIPADAPAPLQKYRLGDYAFSDFGGSFTAKDGKLINNDLGYKDKNLSLAGKGSVTLLDRTLDYSATITAKGVEPVPLHIRGPISDLSISLDLEALARQAAQKGQEKLQEKLQKELKGKIPLPQSSGSGTRSEPQNKEADNLNEILGRELQQGLEKLLKK